MARALLIFVLVASISSAQQGTADADVKVALYGRVTNAQTREPVRRAAVKIYTATQQWDELTDSEGRFKFPPLGRAEYGFAAHRDGYTDRSYKIELSDFDKPAELQVEMFPRGVVTGRVLGDSGRPLQRSANRGIIAFAPAMETRRSRRLHRDKRSGRISLIGSRSGDVSNSRYLSRREKFRIRPRALDDRKQVLWRRRSGIRGCDVKAGSSDQRHRFRIEPGSTGDRSRDACDPIPEQWTAPFCGSSETAGEGGAQRSGAKRRV